MVGIDGLSEWRSMKIDFIWQRQRSVFAVVFISFILIFSVRLRFATIFDRSIKTDKYILILMWINQNQFYVFDSRAFDVKRELSESWHSGPLRAIKTSRKNIKRKTKASIGKTSAEMNIAMTYLSRCSSSASGVHASASMECDVVSSLELFPPGVCELLLLFGSTRRSDGCRTIEVDDGRSVNGSKKKCTKLESKHIGIRIE